MASINKCIIVGNVGKDPDIKNSNGTTIARFSVATTDKWTDNQGQRQERTEWHSITFFGKIADVVAQYVHKGSQVYVEGSLRTNKYTDNNGVERYSTGITGSVIQLLDRKQDNNQPHNNGFQQQPQQQYQQAPQQYQQAPQQYQQNPQQYQQAPQSGQGYSNQYGQPQNQPNGGYPNLPQDVPF